MLQRTLALGALLGMAYGGAITLARYQTRGDEFDVDVTPSERLAGDAPRLHVFAEPRLGRGRVASR